MKHTSTFTTLKTWLTMACLMSVCLASHVHAQKTLMKLPSKVGAKIKAKLNVSRVVTVHCNNQYANVRDSSCRIKRVGLPTRLCNKVRTGHQVVVKNNQISSVLGAYRSWAGEVKVVNAIDRYLEVKSCEAQCRIGATPAMLRNLNANQKVRVLLTQPLSWNGRNCSGNARSIQRL